MHSVSFFAKTVEIAKKVWYNHLRLKFGSEKNEQLSYAFISDTCNGKC